VYGVFKTKKSYIRNNYFEDDVHLNKNLFIWNCFKKLSITNNNFFLQCIFCRCQQTKKYASFCNWGMEIEFKFNSFSLCLHLFQDVAEFKAALRQSFSALFTACSCVFKVITLIGSNQGNFFENATTCSKRMRKTLVATQLKELVLKMLYYACSICFASKKCFYQSKRTTFDKDKRLNRTIR